MSATSEIAIPQSAEDIAPSWVQQVLQKDLPGVSITDVHVKGSISQGEGFMSDIIAFDAVGIRNGASQRYSLVAKLTDFERPLTMIKQWSKDFQIRMETTEVKFYSNAIPELLSVAIPSYEIKSMPRDEDDDSQPPVDSLKFLPKCYFAATDPSSMVSVRVMENLKAQGFSIKAGSQSLNREEMMLTAGALAQLHGLSHRLELRAGVPLPEKCDWMIVRRSDIQAVLKDFAVGRYLTGVKEFAAVFPDQTDLIARLEKLYMKIRPMEDDPRPKVLSHADCYINNIMIKYAEDVPTDVRLVDWQTLRCVPLTYDLTLLFLCNAGWDVFHNHRDAILAHYHHKLMETLGTNESPGLRSYTLEQLKADFKADCLNGVFNRFIRLMVLPADPDLLKILQEIQEWGSI
ncbi:PREDICTED: uncharacterized protein LOC109474180 [Branchiostoma belcheri]|uniref:Uncharacterized protein LOC109474180 n=1 Tax=Branchiostoma belcheri TaxID=7741 RepID=A0A6P4YKJ1_BRABE|nr:PREDICTED: uncharacterized protein LOC109474180 [Branchiostoma belcheri]XP_019629990.1 PREDICTED: uncharacterized protein LOC109474180 [Branchiostoma belcheri]